MIELRLHPGQLGLQRGPLVDETPLEDGQRGGHGILIKWVVAGDAVRGSRCASSAKAPSRVSMAVSIAAGWAPAMSV